MKYFWPDKNYSWKQLEKISAKKKGLWTWPFAALVWLSKNGIEVRNIERFDYQKFIRKGENYLIELLGTKVGATQIKHSDISQERRLSKIFIKSIKTEQRLPTIRDIKSLLQNGFLPICNINARSLNKKEGYAGHFVVVIGFTQNRLLLHDPGLPPFKDRKVSFREFEKAWAYPNKTSKNIMAFRKKLF